MSTYTDAVLALPGIVGLWPMNEASGTTMTNLYSGAGTAGNATYAGSGITYNQASLLPGDSGNSCVLMDGTNGRATINENSALDITAQITLMMWIQPNDISTDRSLIYKSAF